MSSSGSDSDEVVRNKPTNMDDSSSSDSGDEFEPEPEQTQVEADESSSESPEPAPKPVKKNKKSEDEPRESVKAPPKPTDNKAKAKKAQGKARAKKKSSNRSSPRRNKYQPSAQELLAAEYVSKAVELARDDEEGDDTRVLAYGIAANVIEGKVREAKRFAEAKKAGKDESKVSVYDRDTVTLPPDFFATSGLLMPETNIRNLINQVNDLLYAERPRESIKKTGEKVMITAKVVNLHIELSSFDEESITFTVS